MPGYKFCMDGYKLTFKLNNRCYSYKVSYKEFVDLSICKKDENIMGNLWTLRYNHKFLCLWELNVSDVLSLYIMFYLLANDIDCMMHDGY